MPGEGGWNGVAVPGHVANLPARQPETQQQAGGQREGEHQREDERGREDGGLRGHAAVLKVWGAV